MRYLAQGDGKELCEKGKKTFQRRTGTGPATVKAGGPSERMITKVSFDHGTPHQASPPGSLPGGGKEGEPKQRHQYQATGRRISARRPPISPAGRLVMVRRVMGER